MITVAILINGQPLFARSAVNVRKSNSKPGLCVYEVDDGGTIYHDPGDGAVKLAHKLLGRIKEKL